MEEEAKSRRERLARLLPKSDTSDATPLETQGENKFETADTLAEKIIQQSENNTTIDLQSEIKKPNWDLKKEYERKTAKLEEQRLEKLEELRTSGAC